MTTSVYLAARFSRQHELRGYAANLRHDGIHVTSRWHDGAHAWTGTDDQHIPRAVQARFAQEDLDDIDQSHALILFADPPDNAGTRGGAQFEAGYAYGMGIRLIVVSYRQHIFCSLPDVIFCPDPESALAYVRGLTLRSNGRAA